MSPAKAGEPAIHAFLCTSPARRGWRPCGHYDGKRQSASFRTISTLMRPAPAMKARRRSVSTNLRRVVVMRAERMTNH